MSSAEIRGQLVRALELDVIGPGRGHALEGEVLSQAPSRWYLTGFLVPFQARPEEKEDPAAGEQVDLPGAAPGAGDDEDTPEPASARKVFLPSSIGVSVLVPAEARSLRVGVEWGDYELTDLGLKGPAADEGPAAARAPKALWQRR